jgi:Kef-type K+ transport system membrane component KefB
MISALFFFELAVILLAARGVGWLATRYLGQPQVVGEMVAGVVLGPSLLGLFAPDLQAALFPKAAMGALYIIAQVGVGLYMFLVGLEFPRDQFRRSARSAALVSFAGMGAPFLIACVVAPLLTRVPGLFGPAVTPFLAILFVGSAMAITAFPMLARIISERGLSGTPLGALSLAAGAIDDAGSWIVLAMVLAALGEGWAAAVRTILGGVAFAVLAITLGPRLLAPLNRMAERAGGVGPGLLAAALILFALAAGAMDGVGIHAVFGGFILGAVTPRGLFAREVKRQIEPFTAVVLLPFFFTYSGLNTRLALVSAWPLVLITLGVIFASVIAKGGACYLAARASGQTHRTAFGIGALMNARGLMELILINIGLQHHVIGPALFAVLALMAIVTTMMATPLFELAMGDATRPKVDALKGLA